MPTDNKPRAGVLYLVSAVTHYEGGTVLRAYFDKESAEAFRAACEAHQEARPQCADLADDDDGGWDLWRAEYRAWDEAHPGGAFGSGANEFCVEPVDLFAPTADLARQAAKVLAGTGWCVVPRTVAACPVCAARTVDPHVSAAPDAMCPNCLTPWKCNGPHEPVPASPLAAAAPETEQPHAPR
jgi:hypothetical protein